MNNVQWRLEVGNGLNIHWVKRIGILKKVNNEPG